MALIFIVVVSCEREPTDEVEFATFAKTSEIFTDAPVGLGSNFYFPFSGSKLSAWSVDDNEGYESESSMRFDVPNADDPEGNYAGAIFRIDGAGRDLTEFDALTFWAKASQGVSIGVLGFGLDFLGDKYVAEIRNTRIGTNWTKYIIPIPDASKLFDERGMFQYSAGTQNTGGLGYTFWIDDLKFEKLGTIGKPRPAIAGGLDLSSQSFIGTRNTIEGRATFNLPTGFDVEVETSPSYFDWTSSAPSVVAIEEDGYVSVIGSGTSVVTAILDGVQAEGSVTIEVLGAFDPAPTPTSDPADVISIFSDAYDNVPVDFYNGYWAPYQTTLGQNDIYVDGDSVINYTDLNFVGIGTYENVAPINANEMTHLHLDINVREAIQPGDFIRFELINNVGGLETSGTFTVDGSQLMSLEWVGLDLPLNSFSGLTERNQLGLIILVSDATISNIYVDNIYYYKE